MTTTKRAAGKKASQKSSAKKATSKKTTKKTTNKTAAAKKGDKKTTATKNTTKQAAAKKTAGKAEAKSDSKKARARRTTTDTSPTVTLPEHAFWVNDGAVLHSLRELAEALRVMDEAVYMHHVNQERHDFADWVEQALAEAACAQALRSAQTPNRACTVVVTHLKRYPS